MYSALLLDDDSVNSSLFKTNINFIIHYRDEMRLDADMFDSVQEYLDV